LLAKQAIDRARLTGFVDPGTGLYNRRGFDRRLRELGAEAQRSHQPVACIVLTADAPVLESAVDSVEEVARSVAEFFKVSGRTADVVARLGPLRFAVIAPATAGEGAARLVERVGAAIMGGVGTDAPELGGITIRAGFWVLPDGAEEPVQPEEVLARASSMLVVPS
jgi:diguanylate cyclase (GGDEF)-like protein